MESFSFSTNQFWVIPPHDMTQFMTFYEAIQSDLQAREKRLLQQREREIKTKAVDISTSDFGEAEAIDLTEEDIDDLRKELEAISSL
jgi:hypothetical protein